MENEDDEIPTAPPLSPIPTNDDLDLQSQEVSVLDPEDNPENDLPVENETKISKLEVTFVKTPPPSVPQPLQQDEIPSTYGTYPDDRVSEAGISPHQIYRSELHIPPIMQPTPSESPSKKSQKKDIQFNHRCHLRKVPEDAVKGAQVELVKRPNWRPEDLPQVNISSKVKYFEAQIEKEKEGVKKNRDAYNYLTKHQKEDICLQWGKKEHEKYYKIPCEDQNCPSVSKAPMKNKEIKSESDDDEPTVSSKNSKLIKKQSNSIIVIPDKAVPIYISIDESTSTRNSNTAAAISSQALVLSKEISNLPDVENATGFYKILSNTGSYKLVFVKFYATWCRPCQVMAPIVLELANYYRDITFFQVDIDKVPVEEILEHFDVGHIPAFFLFRDSVQIDKIEGQTSKSSIEKLIQRNIR